MRLTAESTVFQDLIAGAVTLVVKTGFRPVFGGLFRAKLGVELLPE